MIRLPSSSARASPLGAPLAALRGVGPERAAQLARLGLHTIGDLLLHRPRRYEDRRRFLAVADLQLGKAATARGSSKGWYASGRGIFAAQAMSTPCASASVAALT